MDQEKLFRELKAYGGEIRAAHGERDTLLAGVEDMYLMHKTAGDAALESLPDVALTKSTDERVAIQAVVRLLTTTVPTISMPREGNADNEDAADMIERGADALLASSDRANRKPLHYDAVLSAALYDMGSIRVTCAQDILDSMEQDDSDRRKSGADRMPEGARERIKQALANTPYIFEALNPRGVYPVWDRYGLKAQLNVSKVRVRDIVAQYGDKARRLFADKKISMESERDLYDYTDDVYRCVWVDDEWLVMDEHGLPFINYATSTMEGSGIFGAVVDQYEPHLLTVYRSGLDQRKTEALTAQFTMNKVFGFSPLLKFVRGPNGEEPPSTQRVGLFSLWDVPYGANLEPVLNKGISDPSVWNGLQLAMTKTEEATIYKSVLGQSQSSTYSQTALLSQLGRIPLETVRSMTGRLIADALEIALRWIKKNGKGIKTYNNRAGALAEIIPAQIPDYFNLECKLDIALPQDKLQQANIAAQLIKAGVVSKEWIMENVLNIGQPQQMTKDIWTEQFIDALAGLELQKKLQPPPQPQLPPGGPPQGGGGLPPEMLAGGMGGPEMAAGEQQMMPPEEGIPIA